MYSHGFVDYGRIYKDKEMCCEDGRECGRTEAERTDPGRGVQTLRGDCGEGGRHSPGNALSTAAPYKAYKSASASEECLNHGPQRKLGLDQEIDNRIARDGITWVMMRRSMFPKMLR